MPDLDLTSLPQRPWGWTSTHTEGRHPGTGYVWIVDPNGRKLISIYGTAAERVAMAEFITAMSRGEVHVPQSKKR